MSRKRKSTYDEASIVSEEDVVISGDNNVDNEQILFNENDSERVEDDDTQQNVELVRSGGGGDEGVLEGAAIGDGNNEDSASDSESDEDDGVVIVVSGTTSSAPSQRGRRLYEKGANSYIRPESLKDMGNTARPAAGDGDGSGSTKRTLWDDLKPLQFSYHRTAFDVNLEQQEAQPWRLPHTDMSDYFNYGFTEATWLKYCESQLRLRVADGLGPTAVNSAAAGPTAGPGAGEGDGLYDPEADSEAAY